MDIAFCRVRTVGDDPGRVADDDAVGWDVLIHVGIGRDQYIVTDGDLSDQDCVGPYPDFVSEGRGALTGAAVFCADCDAFVQIAVIADDGEFADADVVGMPEVEPPADGGESSSSP